MRSSLDWIGTHLALAMLAGCFESSVDSSGNVASSPPPQNGGEVNGPPAGEPPPTGMRGTPIVADDGCGRERLVWVYEDEVCGGTDRSDYARAFHAPMFRDGALINNTLFAVDATHLWVLDASQRDNVERVALISGMGEPIAVAKDHDRLLLAAGSEGLVVVDASNPREPKRIGAVAMDGFALDVHVEADRAWVAAGAGGIVAVDLTTNPPRFDRAIPIPGYAAAIKTRGKYAYVAACESFFVVDLETGTLVSQLGIPDALRDQIVVAPAKDIELVGDVAFVAAGRAGAIGINVHDPGVPFVIGHCTVNEPSFYASGVRADNGVLYVAGGEWGILRVDVSDPPAACVMRVDSTPPPKHDDTCSAEPPWDVLDWEHLWSVPPPKKDPIQTLPAEGQVFAFGDARRIGTRAVDIRDTADRTLPLRGRFDEPRKLLGVAVSRDRIATVGSSGGLYRRNGDGRLTPTDDNSNGALTKGTAVVFDAQNKWVTLSENQIFREGKQAGISLSRDTSPDQLVVAGDDILVSNRNAIGHCDPSGALSWEFVPKVAHLPVSIAADANATYVSAAEWTASFASIRGQSVPLRSHGVFDAKDVENISEWRVALPRKLLVPTTHGLVELAELGTHSGLVLHKENENVKIDFPAWTFAGATSMGNRVYVVAIDRALYRSTLVSVDISNDAPRLIATEVFTGAASGIAASDGVIYVTDADGFVRIYREQPAGVQLVESMNVTNSVGAR